MTTSRLTKNQKKEMRKKIYNEANKCYKCFEEEHLDGLIFEKYKSFFKHIKNGDFNESIKTHRILNKIESFGIDSVVFDKKNKYTSEETRVTCNNIKRFNDKRRELLKGAMKLDAEIGYWKLSK